MLNGTETQGSFLPAPTHQRGKQGVFPEKHVLDVYRSPLIDPIIQSKYVGPWKGLKGRIKLDTSALVFFCRLIPISLWGGSLLAVARGGTLCQLGND